VGQTGAVIRWWAGMILVIDNYDSFTFNLVQYLEMLGARCEVFYNDALDAEAACAKAPRGILISPGPCTPNEAGVSLSLIARAAGKIPVLGVCLGHQAIGQVFGGKVVRAGRIMHGKTSPIEHDGRTVYAGLDRPFTATRYHSLLVERESLPDCLEIAAWTAEGEIMGLRHKTLAVEGVQYHPESILTTSGMALLRNWVASLPPEHARG
jgi:anthranilate synthase/aminodeoxychorismate synthase-like glutamine amidotransferase